VRTSSPRNRAPFLRRPVLFTVFLAFLVILTLAGIYPLHVLRIENPRTGEAFFVRPVRLNDTFSLSYKHSVELCRIWDFYRVGDGYRLLLDATSFGSSNTGLPALLGKGETLTREKNGYRISNMRRELPYVDFWVHAAYENTLEFAGESVNLPLLAGNALLRLSIQKTALFAFVGEKFQNIIHNE